jgi:hypothetical protein
MRCLAASSHDGRPPLRSAGCAAYMETCFLDVGFAVLISRPRKDMLRHSQGIRLLWPKARADYSAQSARSAIPPHSDRQRSGF